MRGAMATLRYFGHASFELVFGDTVLFIDPYFASGGERLLPSAVQDVHWVKRCDIILATHEHFDHLDKEAVTEIVERTYASVVAPGPALRQLKIQEKLKVDVKVGDKFELKGVGIEVVKAVHPQSEYPVGYIVEKDGLRVYHAGDTYEFAGMADIRCDYALIPIGGTYTMDMIDAEKAAREIKCRTVIPMHFGTFEKIRDANPEAFARSLAGKVNVRVMKFGEQITL